MSGICEDENALLLSELRGQNGLILFFMIIILFLFLLFSSLLLSCVLLKALYRTTLQLRNFVTVVATVVVAVTDH